MVPTTPAGCAQLPAWVVDAAEGARVVWAIEGTRHCGFGLARFLQSHDQQVEEIDSRRHLGERRAGKSDPIDTLRAAKELFARPTPGVRRADGDREALRSLMIDRDNAVDSTRSFSDRGRDPSQDCRGSFPPGWCHPFSIANKEPVFDHCRRGGTRQDTSARGPDQ